MLCLVPGRPMRTNQVHGSHEKRKQAWQAFHKVSHSILPSRSTVSQITSLWTILRNSIRFLSGAFRSWSPIHTFRSCRLWSQDRAQGRQGRHSEPATTGTRGARHRELSRSSLSLGLSAAPLPRPGGAGLTGRRAGRWGEGRSTFCGEGPQ